MEQLKAIFLGTPEFATNSLKSLIETEWIDVQCVITQPDRPANRGKKIIPPPVKVFAEENNIEVFQTQRISKDVDLLEKIKAYNPDVLITCAFGQILSQKVLDIALTLNVHASLLPKYRGAAPINYAILNGEKETGITIMKTVKALDAGPVLIAEKCSIEENETSAELFNKLSTLGGKALIRGLELVKDNKVNFQEQDEAQVTYASMLKKEMGQIDWSKPALEIHNQIRGLQPWPSAYTKYNGKSLKVWKALVRDKVQGLNDKVEGRPGEIIEIGETILIQTGDGILDLLEVQPENKKAMDSKDWANGARLSTGDILGN